MIRRLICTDGMIVVTDRLLVRLLGRYGLDADLLLRPVTPGEEWTDWRVEVTRDELRERIGRLQHHADD